MGLFGKGFVKKKKEEKARGRGESLLAARARIFGAVAGKIMRVENGWSEKKKANYNRSGPIAKPPKLHFSAPPNCNRSVPEL